MMGRVCVMDVGAVVQGPSGANRADDLAPWEGRTTMSITGSIMPFGRYRGWPLSELPMTYIFWLNTHSIREPLRSALDAEMERRAKKSRTRRSAMSREGM